MCICVSEYMLEPVSTLTQYVTLCLYRAELSIFEEHVNIHCIYSYLITHDASVYFDIQNDRCTPLHLACTQGATEVVKLMLSSVDRVEDIINLTDGACQTPLHRWALEVQDQLVLIISYQQTKHAYLPKFNYCVTFTNYIY